MNQDIVKGKWTQLKGKIREQWGKLTDDDIVQIDGKAEAAIGRLQERYGYARDHAEKEWRKFCDCNESVSAKTTRAEGTE